MINLIPHKARQVAKREYLARVVVVYLSLVIVAIVASGLFLLPSFLQISLEASALKAQMVDISEERKQVKALQAELTKAQQMLVGIESFEALDPLLPYVYALQTLATTDITLAQLRIERGEDGDVEVMRISGIADSRVALATFEDKIEQSKNFGEVVIPLANLAREEDIPFTLTVPIEEQ